MDGAVVELIMAEVDTFSAEGATGWAAWGSAWQKTGGLTCICGTLAEAAVKIDVADDEKAKHKYKRELVRLAGLAVAVYADIEREGWNKKEAE